VNADPIARWYRWLEYIGFGGALQRRREAFLNYVGDARRVIVLGEGDGRSLAKLAQQNRDASIDYVDLSEQMLQLARNRAGTERITYHQADALTIALPDHEYDLIVTHFFLDCLDEMDAERLVRKLIAAARPNARWIVSEFRDRSAWSRAVITVLYGFFRLTTGLRTRRLVDHNRIFLRFGLSLLRDEVSAGGLLVSEVWAILPEKPR
jgi:ubiquinone/menaquinone biosynthesis C-methylase UbiE